MKSINYSYVLLLLLGAASVVVQSLTLAVALVCFSSIHGYSLWLDKQKNNDINETIKKELEDVKNYVSMSTIQRATKQPQKPIEIF